MGRKKVRILTIPLCWGPPEGLPRHFRGLRHFSKTHSRGRLSRILCFPEKKLAKVPFLSPGPNVDRSRSPGPRARVPGFPGPKFRNRWPSTSMGVSKGGYSPAARDSNRACVGSAGRGRRLFEPPVPGPVPEPAPVDIGGRGQNGHFCPTFFRKNTKSSITGLGSGFCKNAEDHKNDGADPPDPASIVG